MIWIQESLTLPDRCDERVVSQIKARRNWKRDFYIQVVDHNICIFAETASQMYLLIPKARKRQGTDMLDRLHQKPIGWGEKIIPKSSK